MLPTEHIESPAIFNADTKFVIQTLCCAAVSLLDADLAVIALLSETRHHVIATDGLGGLDSFDMPRTINPVSFNRPLFGVVTRHANTAVAETCPLFNGQIDRLKTALWVPLKNGHECYGMIAVGYRDIEPDLWDAERNNLMRVARGARQALGGMVPQARAVAQTVSLPVQRFLI